MNKLVLSLNMALISFLMASSAVAQIKTPPTPPPQFEGNYSIKPNSIELKSVRHELTIFLVNEEAHKYVAKLRAGQYACQNYDSRTVKCSRFFKDPQTFDQSFENVYEKYRDQKLEIFPSDSRAELINDAEYLTKWKLVQNVKWQGQKFTTVNYSVIKDPTLPENLVKLKLTNDADQNAYFYVRSNVDGLDIAFQHMELLVLKPSQSFIRKEVMNCLLEVPLTR